MEETIKRVDALKLMDKKETFSIQFYKSNGEVVSLFRAKTIGMNQHYFHLRIRNVQAIDASGEKIGHAYAVSIDSIRMFNGAKVIL